MSGTTAEAVTGSLPRISGPLSGGKHGWPFAASLLDVASLGYREDEYLVEGSALSFRLCEGTEYSRDGLWQAEPAGKAEYRTRILVYRPIDPRDFNGSVVVTWNNVTAGYELFSADSRELFEGGFVLVCASVQKVGIEGLPPVRQGLADWDPDRYGSLHIPGDDYSFDIFSQIARAVGPSRSTSALDPLAGLTVSHVIAQGASQSAGRLATYINAVAPLDCAFDGFILSIYFGRGSPLEVGDAVVNINAPAQPGSAMERLRGQHCLRDDLGMPIFVVNSELEAMACLGVRQPDSDSFRYWESAGTCHVSQQMRRLRQELSDRDQLVTRPGEDSINAIPMNSLYDAAFYHMHRWLNDQILPPEQPKIVFTDDGDVVRDSHGIAIGGIRLPQADVPLAQNSAIPLSDDIFAVLGGSCRPFPKNQITAMYGDKADFLQRFTEAAQSAVAEGVLRPREVSALVAEADERFSKLE